ncbi:MAG TPA: protein sip-5 [Pseudoxanthomonas sp.]|nr:protein sip-5 [Pseudoxanthomonas sp.]
MNFERALRRVEKAEQLVEGRALQTQTHWSEFKSTWREAWTPGRIIVAGLVTGFLSGRAEPMRAMTGAKWLQMVGSLSSLFASVTAATAAGEASTAADEASTAADEAGDAADSAHAAKAGVAAPSQPDVDVEERVTAPLDYPEERLVEDEFAERVVVQPRPAEAATEVSER